MKRFPSCVTWACLLVAGTAPTSRSQTLEQPASANSSGEHGGATSSEPAPAEPMEFDPGTGTDPDSAVPAAESIFSTYVAQPSRLTLRHEYSFSSHRLRFEDYDPQKPDGTINNRTYLRLEYSKFLLGNIFLQFDGRTTSNWKNDHQAIAAGEDIHLDTRIREAYVQGSFGNTSIKAGIIILVWGESEAGAITDEVSPRDNSEAFFVTLEESRLGQPMATLQQFTSFGDLSAFFVPFPAFNEYPKPGTAYYVDPFQGMVQYSESDLDNTFEFGAKWRKTLGKTDLGVMAASLVDNDRVQDMIEPDMVLERQNRFFLAGFTANHPLNNFLLKTEVAGKFSKAFNDQNLSVVHKNVVAASLAFDYSAGGTFSASVDLVHDRVLDWTSEIAGVPEATNTVVLVFGDSFLHETLNINWMSLVNVPDASLFHNLSIAYSWTDRLSQTLDLYYPDATNEKSRFWTFRDQKQASMKLQYQF